MNWAYKDFAAAMTHGHQATQRVSVQRTRRLERCDGDRQVHRWGIFGPGRSRRGRALQAGVCALLLTRQSELPDISIFICTILHTWEGTPAQ